jgi:hypothetical protein
MTLIRCSDCLGWSLGGFPFLVVVVLAGLAGICFFPLFFHTALLLIIIIVLPIQVWCYYW